MKGKLKKICGYDSIFKLKFTPTSYLIIFITQAWHTAQESTHSHSLQECKAKLAMTQKEKKCGAICRPRDSARVAILRASVSPPTLGGERFRTEAARLSIKRLKSSSP